MRIVITLTFSFLVLNVFGQQASNLFAFTESTEITVLSGNDTIRNAWAGGLSYGEVNTIDMNGDGREDLVIFDKVGSRITTFIDTKQSGQAVFEYAPQYRSAFPEADEWMLMRDFNCDGKKDIFAGYNGSVRVYENVSSGGELKFVKAHSTDHLKARYTGGPVNLFVPSTDVPAIIDLDDDGDLDIITFGNQTDYVEWIENQQNCGLDFELRESCWGHFRESAFTNKVFLGSCLPFKRKAMHSGGAILALDLNGDNVKEILISDISFNTILALYNTGTLDSAYMSSQDTLFPSYDTPVNLMRFPAAFYEDVDGDGKKDLILSPNEERSGAYTHNSMWLYKNTGSNSNPVFNFTRKNFMQKSQIEMGEGCVPRFADLDGDGLMDLILANAGYLTSSGSYKSTLSHYRNTGTATQPEFTLIDSNMTNISSFGLGLRPVPTFGDLDNDMDLDMIVGDENGKLHLFTNSGNITAPNFTLNTGGGLGSLDVGSDAAPFLFDIDDDGDLDLVVGNNRGKLSYYENSSASSPSFQLVNSFFGGVDVRGPYNSSGSSVPYIFEKDSIINLMVGSENGIFQYDSVAKVVDLPDNITGTFGSGTTISSSPEESPLGNNYYSGRNQILILASELKSQGMEAGFVTGLTFEIATSSNPIVYKVEMSMKNVNFDSLDHFVTSGMDSVLLEQSVGVGQGWARIGFDFPFRWDGTSNLLIQICFKGSPPNKPIKVYMDNTPFKSYAWGDITNFNKATAQGCKMPFLGSGNKRPNMKLDITPSFVNTNVILKDGLLNSAAFHDLDGDGFIDAVLGNYAGGVSYYKGKLYDIGIEENEVQAIEGLQVFPNPGTGEFSVVTSNMSRAILKVYDLTGRFIQEIEISEDLTPVNLSNEPAGIYLFVMQSEKGIRTEKVILE